jgi:hypothetical protein
MYPRRELTNLAANKARLQRQLARQRAASAMAAAELGRPIAWLDHARSRWRRVSPLVEFSGLLFGVFAGRPIFSRARRINRWVRLAVAAAGLFRGMSALRR